LSIQYFPNQKIKHIDFEQLHYGNKTIWFNLLENEYGTYLLIQKKKKINTEWVQEHSITIPLEHCLKFSHVLKKILSSEKIKQLIKN